jgi:hypothetical protein
MAHERADDLTKWFSAAGAFLAMAHTFRRGDFVRVTLLIEHVGSARGACWRRSRCAIAAVACGYLAFWATRSTYESWLYRRCPTASSRCRCGSRSSRSWSAPCCSRGAWRAARHGAARAQARLRGRVEERHARGDFSEDI